MKGLITSKEFLGKGIVKRYMVKVHLHAISGK